MSEKTFKPPWQPMSTAPKGPNILLWKFGLPCIGCWNSEKYHTKPHPHWDTHSSMGVRSERNTEPTAWMPLPDAPEDALRIHK